MFWLCGIKQNILFKLMSPISFSFFFPLWLVGSLLLWPVFEARVVSYQTALVQAMPPALLWDSGREAGGVVYDTTREAVTAHVAAWPHKLEKSRCSCAQGGSTPTLQEAPAPAHGMAWQVERGTEFNPHLAGSLRAVHDLHSCT